MNHPCQIDPAALERLRRLGGEEFIFKMADLFLSNGAQKIGEARRAFETANLAEVAKAVHSLKSSAGNIGALEVQDLAAKIERLAAQSQRDSLASLLQELELSFGRTKVDLESRAAARGHGDNASTP
jgi:HPt (histidine-containing phosphotransfer) domain-containing protein